MLELVQLVSEDVVFFEAEENSFLILVNSLGVEGGCLFSCLFLHGISLIKYV